MVYDVLIETLDDNSDIIQYTKNKTKNLMIPFPWNDQKIKKIGLYDMYIIDSITEHLDISAEATPEIKLINPNPKYQSIVSKLKILLSSTPNTEQAHSHFANLVSEITDNKICIKHWNGKIPDIRVLPLDCKTELYLSWLFSVCVMGESPTELV